MVTKDGQLCYDRSTELPDLTDADIKWLSELSEEMDQFEPPTPIAVMDTTDTDEANCKKEVEDRDIGRVARCIPRS